MNSSVLIRQSLLLHHVFQVLLNLLLKLVQIGHSLGIGEFAQFFQVDDCQLGILFGIFQLLEQFVDLLQFGQGFNRLRNRQGLTPGELVFSRQVIDLILVTERFHQIDKFRGKVRICPFGTVPETFHGIDLLFLHCLPE